VVLPESGIVSRLSPSSRSQNNHEHRIFVRGCVMAENIRKEPPAEQSADVNPGCL
jgi:hypothetical protein